MENEWSFIHFVHSLARSHSHSHSAIQFDTMNEDNDVDDDTISTVTRETMAMAIFYGKQEFAINSCFLRW